MRHKWYNYKEMEALEKTFQRKKGYTSARKKGAPGNIDLFGKRG